MYNNSTDKVYAHQIAFQGAGRKAVVLVFGATGSIGSAFVKEFVSNNKELFVIAIARDSKKLNKLNAQVYAGNTDDSYRHFRHITLNASDPDECVFFANQCQQHALNIQYVVLAAGGLRTDDEFESVKKSMDWHAHSNFLTRIVPYEALRCKRLIVESTVVLVVGSESVCWDLNDERLRREIGYVSSMRSVNEWCAAVRLGHTRGCFRHLLYPLVEGAIADTLKRSGVVSADQKLPTAAQIVRDTMEDLASEHLVPLSVL